MSKYPGVGSVAVNQGGVEAQIGDRGTAIPVTVDGTRLGSTGTPVTLTAPHLYARRTASPYKAVPFTNGTAIINPTNTTNATIDVADADAVKFVVGDTCTFYDVSAAGLDANAGKVISAIGAAGSAGAGETLITFTGVWTAAPVASDILVVADGAQLSANVVLVQEDITFDGATSFATTGWVEGTFLKSKVNNTTYFDQSKLQTLKLVDMQ